MRVPIRGVAVALALAIGPFLGGCGMFGPKADTGAISDAVAAARPGFSAAVDVSTAGGGLSKEVYVAVDTAGATPDEDEFRAVCTAVTSNLGADWVGEILISFRTSAEKGPDGGPAWADISHITSQLGFQDVVRNDHSVQGSLSQLEKACAGR